MSQPYDDLDPCPGCGGPMRQVGKTEFDDRGPFQQIAVQSWTCLNECRPDWKTETDGG